MSIPLENVYYLLCYAWNRLEEQEVTDVSVAGETRLADLFARVLAGGVTHLLKRGLDRAYTAIQEEIPGVRGRLDIATSLKRAAFPRARAWCSFDELTADALHNRIVRATLRRLASAKGLAPKNAELLRELYRRMQGVGEMIVTTRSFAQVTLNRNNSYYGFLLDVCEIVHRNLLVDERNGATVFRDFTRDDKQMAALFEAFVRNFYRREQRRFKVGADTLQWHAEGHADDLAYIPSMRTDIVLRSIDRTFVIDAKYYAEMLQAGLSRETVRSGHLYQLFSYLSNFPKEGGELCGMLLYPRTTETRRIQVALQGYPVTVCTIDLKQSWQGIHNDLLALVY